MFYAYLKLSNIHTKVCNAKTTTVHDGTVYFMSMKSLISMCEVTELHRERNKKVGRRAV